MLYVCMCVYTCYMCVYVYKHVSARQRGEGGVHTWVWRPAEPFSNTRGVRGGRGANGTGTSRFALEDDR